MTFLEDKHMFNYCANASQEDAAGTQPRMVYMHKCMELECWPTTAVVSQLHLAYINFSFIKLDTKCKYLARTPDATYLQRDSRLCFGVPPMFNHEPACVLHLISAYSSVPTSLTTPIFTEVLQNPCAGNRSSFNYTPHQTSYCSNFWRLHNSGAMSRTLPQQGNV